MDNKEYFEMLQEKWNKHWPKYGPKQPVYPHGKIPITEYLSKRAQLMPDKEMLIFYGRHFDYQEIYDLSNRFANFLLETGHKKGDRVGIHLLNCPQFFIIHYGVLKAGCVLVTLDPAFKDMELNVYFDDAEMKSIVTHDEHFPMIKSLADKFKLENIITTNVNDYVPEEPIIPQLENIASIKKEVHPGALDLIELLEQQKTTPVDVLIQLEDYASMDFTGGTTGLPKACMHTHEGIVYTRAVMTMWDQLRYPPEEIIDNTKTLFLEAGERLKIPVNGEEFDTKINEYLKILSLDNLSLIIYKLVEDFGLTHLSVTKPAFIFAPIFHTAARSLVEMIPMTGGTCCLMVRFDFAGFLAALKNYRVNEMWGPVELYLGLMSMSSDLKDTDFSSLSTCSCTAYNEKLTPEVRENWRQLTKGGLLSDVTYGLTETLSMNTFTAGLQHLDLTKDLGFVGIPCPESQIKIVDFLTHEILPLGQEGHLAVKDPALSPEYYRRPKETAACFLSDGFLLTGDVARYDEDGFLYLQGRTKDIIKVSGWSVYPVEMEELLKNYPGVNYVSVVGIPDEKKGEVPVLFMKLLPGQESTEEAVIKWCKENMAPYKIPKYVRFKEEFPMIMGLKVDKNALKKEALTIVD